MLGGTLTDLAVTVLLLFLTLTGTQCRGENDFSLVTLPEERTSSEYVTQCFFDGQVNPSCDWTSQRSSAQDDATLDVLELGPLGMEGEACLEFWYLPPAAANGSELRVHLKSAAGRADIWASPVLPRDSWRRVFVPLTITEPGTEVVFEAMGETSTEEQIEVKHIGVRRGSCGPQCESNTEFWTDGSTRCHCSAGQLLCSPSRCPAGQTCGPESGRAKGAPAAAAAGMCTIHRHTDCSTFDGALFRFMAPCTYVLAETCSPAKALPEFSLEVVNEREGNASLPTVQRISLDMGDMRVTLLKKQTKRVVVNGVWRKLPLNLGRGAVNIRSNPAAIVLKTRFGLSVSYDSAGAVQVALPPSFSDHVCGLCGNFNHLKDDDLHKPNGTDGGNATASAASGRTGEAASSCETISVPHQCDPQEEAEYASEMYCGGLLSGSGPFSGCLSALGAESYFRACLVSMCSSQGDPEVLCDTLQAYAEVCQEAGVAVSTWRNSTSCSLRCGANSHYNSCADGCPEVCSSHDLAGPCGSCEERCECDSGFKLSGGKCVPAEDCGCWQNGKHYEKGETLMAGDCEQHCQCMGNNAMRCTFTQCKTDEVCKVQDGVKGCFPFRPATCSVYGDPHYITFDRWAYDFQGGCSYTLATTCGEDSAVQFSVTGHNAHPALTNAERSKLEAVTLEIRDVHLTLNQSGEVYVHNTKLPLPISVNGTFGSIEVNARNSYLVLESSFGLRMMIDGENRLFLQVDERHKYELCGLCGTYSGHQDDDFVTPGGQIVTDAFEFGDSWKIPGTEECVARPKDPPHCDGAGNNQAYSECLTIFGDTFQACHEHVHPSIYLNSCVYDYCATSGDQHTLCESLKSYAAACQVAGVKLPHWEVGTACAVPTTTATTPTTSSPTPVCPMNCNFDENLCGWEQLVQDSFDWTRHSGPTPSQLTGPNQDHTSGAGSYMYLEANSATHGDSARLMSSACRYRVPVCLHFWYHMYGSATAMALNVYLLRDNRATKVWSKVDSQGPEWRPATIDISDPSPFQIIIEGIRGSNDQSDVAIDDISIHTGTCKESFPGLVSGNEGPVSAPAIPSLPICSLDCSFDRSLCSWSQMMTDAFDWTWQSGSTPTLMTGPSADHTGGGHYLYIEASSVSHGDTARLISSECGDSGPQCLQFWYHMYGSADTMGLHVYLLQNKVADSVFRKRNDQGNAWRLAQVDIRTTGAFQIIFEGRRGSNEQSDVAIDDVKLYHGSCSDLSNVVPTHPPTPDPMTTAPPSVPVPTTATAETTIIPGTAAPVCQLQCDFEQDLCGWNQLLADVFDWTRHRGPTPTMLTGPSSDHTTGDGHYLYIEANSATLGDTARLVSSECVHSGPKCLQFWYHMRGSAETMGLHVYLYQNRKAESIWRKRNDQGNMWRLAQVDLAATGKFQVILEGRRGSNDQSDVAIDDVSLHHGRCADLVKPTSPASSTMSPPSTEVTDDPATNSSTTTEAPVTVPETTASVSNETQLPATSTPRPPNTAQPQPETTVRPQPPSTVGPESPTTAGPKPSTTSQPQMTEEPQPETTSTPMTEEPQPETTTTPMTEEPQPETTTTPMTEEPQPETTTTPMTAEPQPESTTTPMTEEPQPETTTTPMTEEPQPETTTTPMTVKPQPESTTTPMTVEPQPESTTTPTTAGPEPTTTTTPTTAEPQPTTTTTPTTTEPQPTTTTQPQPETTAEPQPTSTTTLMTVEPQPETTAEPQPTTTTTPMTVEPQPETTAEPQPTTTTTPMTAEPQPTTTPTTAEPQPEATAEPQPTTTTTPMTAEPQPTTRTPPTTAEPQPPATTKPQPQTTAEPNPPATTGPTLPTATEPQFSTTSQPQPQTTVSPQPPQPETTAEPQPTSTTIPTTAEPQPTTTTTPMTAEPQPTTRTPPTTAEPQTPATTKPQTQTTVEPNPPATTGPTLPTATEPQFSTTSQPQPQTTVSPQPPTTNQSQPQTTEGPEPPPTPAVPTTVQPQPPTTTEAQPETTARPNPPATTQPQTTAEPQPTTTVQPESQTSNIPPSTTTVKLTTTAGTQPKPTTTRQPQTTAPSPTPSCPRNSHYSTCMSACRPTCSSLNGPSHCHDNGPCVPGCVCNDGFVQKSRACVPIRECGCVDRRGNKYQFNEKWYTDHCRQKCECEKDDGRGKIECDDEDECDGNAVCLQDEQGDYYCQSTGFDKCSVDRDSEYKTFDKMKYTFEGERAYVLVRTKNLPGNLQDVYIEGVHSNSWQDDDGDDDSSSSEEEHRDRDDSSEEHNEHRRLRELKIRVYNHTVTLGRNRKLTVDGQRTETPASPSGGINIREHSSHIYLTTDFGLSVEFDGHGAAEIILPRIYKRKTGGLCGNFDGRKQNDKMKPDGSLAQSVDEFGESWAVRT